MSAVASKLSELSASYRGWRFRVFFAAWSMYATFYMCRANISVAVPELQNLLGGGTANSSTASSATASGPARWPPSAWSSPLA